MVFGACTLVSIWQRNQACADLPSNACYAVRDPLDLAIVSAAITGACFGFLVVERLARPDLHGRHRLAVAGRCPRGTGDPDPHRLLLIILGGLFVMVALSVMIQGVLLQGDPQAHRHGQAGIPDDAHPPLRDARLGAGHGRDRFWIIPGLCVATGSASSTPVGGGSMTDPHELGRHESWDGVTAVVAGFGGVASLPPPTTCSTAAARVIALGREGTTEAPTALSREADLLRSAGR